MREQREKLIFGSVRANQFLTQSDVPCLVFHEIQHALDGLFRTLESKEIHVHKSGHAALIGEGLLHQLEWRAESKHFLDRFRRGDLHFVVARVVNVLFLWEGTEAFCHFAECLVSLKEMPRIWIDQGDAARHVSQDLFAKDHFAFDSSRSLGLSPGGLPRENRAK